MSLFLQDDGLRSPRRALFAAGIVLCCGAALCIAAAPSDEPTPDAVGTIEGEAIALRGPMQVEVVRGQMRTVLRSGSDVQVKSGEARIDLVEGGQIAICGPAHLSVLKSGGSLTVALDSGTIHFHIQRAPALTIYTPQIQAKPVAIGDSAQDALVGLDATGAMCLRADSGALRVEQQLTGQAVIVPQGGDVLLTNGQIDSLRPSAGRCSCELQTVKATPPDAGMVASAEEVRLKNPPSPPQPAPEKPPAKEEPVYKVFMPPLAFDASAKVQPEPDPQLILLVRRARVRPTLIFRGRVEGEAVAVALNPSPPPAAAPQAAAAPQKKAPAANDSVVDRVRSFLRRIWTRNS
jgi:hypothetical protein